MRAGSQQNVWKVLRGHQQQETHRLKMTFVRPHEVSAVLTDPLMVVLREVHLHTHTHVIISSVLLHFCPFVSYLFVTDGHIV